MPEGTTLPRTVKRLLADEPSPSSTLVPAATMDWEVTKFPGIQMKMLFNDGQGFCTMLFKLAPGAVVPLHEHTGIEQTYVLEGSLEDDEGPCTAGNFVWRPAGNTHEAVAPNGAVILSVFTSPNHFAAGHKFFTEEKRG